MTGASQGFFSPEAQHYSRHPYFPRHDNVLYHLPGSIGLLQSVKNRSHNSSRTTESVDVPETGCAPDEIQRMSFMETDTFRMYFLASPSCIKCGDNLPLENKSEGSQSDISTHSASANWPVISTISDNTVGSPKIDQSNLLAIPRKSEGHLRIGILLLNNTCERSLQQAVKSALDGGAKEVHIYCSTNARTDFMVYLRMLNPVISVHPLVPKVHASGNLGKSIWEIANPFSSAWTKKEITELCEALELVTSLVFLGPGAESPKISFKGLRLVVQPLILKARENETTVLLAGSSLIVSILSFCHEAGLETKSLLNEEVCISLLHHSEILTIEEELFRIKGRRSAMGVYKAPLPEVYLDEGKVEMSDKATFIKLTDRENLSPKPVPIRLSYLGRCISLSLQLGYSNIMFVSNKSCGGGSPTQDPEVVTIIVTNGFIAMEDSVNLLPNHATSSQHVSTLDMESTLGWAAVLRSLAKNYVNNSDTLAPFHPIDYSQSLDTTNAASAISHGCCYAPYHTHTTNPRSPTIVSPYKPADMNENTSHFSTRFSTLSPVASNRSYASYSLGTTENSPSERASSPSEFDHDIEEFQKRINSAPKFNQIGLAPSSARRLPKVRTPRQQLQGRAPYETLNLESTLNDRSDKGLCGVWESRIPFSMDRSLISAAKNVVRDLQIHCCSLTNKRAQNLYQLNHKAADFKMNPHAKAPPVFDIYAHLPAKHLFQLDLSPTFGYTLSEKPRVPKTCPVSLHRQHALADCASQLVGNTEGTREVQGTPVLYALEDIPQKTACLFEPASKREQTARQVDLIVARRYMEVLSAYTAAAQSIRKQMGDIGKYRDKGCQEATDTQDLAAAEKWTKDLVLRRVVKSEYSCETESFFVSHTRSKTEPGRGELPVRRDMLKLYANDVPHTEGPSLPPIILPQKESDQIRKTDTIASDELSISSFYENESPEQMMSNSVRSSKLTVQQEAEGSGPWRSETNLEQESPFIRGTSDMYADDDVDECELQW